MLTDAESVLRTNQEGFAEVEFHLVQGDLMREMSDDVAAEQLYRQALAIAQNQSAKAFELRAATSLARVWRDQGKRTEARDPLTPIYSWFTEGFDTPVIKDAGAARSAGVIVLSRFLGHQAGRNMLRSSRASIDLTEVESPSTLFTLSTLAAIRRNASARVGRGFSV